MEGREKNEMKACLGIHVYMSAVKLPKTDKCTGAKGSFGIAVIMRRHWFVKISQYFHANNRGVMSIIATRAADVTKLRPPSKTQTNKLECSSYSCVKSIKSYLFSNSKIHIWLFMYR